MRCVLLGTPVFLEVVSVDDRTEFLAPPRCIDVLGRAKGILAEVADQVVRGELCLPVDVSHDLNECGSGGYFELLPCPVARPADATWCTTVEAKKCRQSPTEDEQGLYRMLIAVQCKDIEVCGEVYYLPGCRPFVHFVSGHSFLTLSRECSDCVASRIERELALMFNPDGMMDKGG